MMLRSRPGGPQHGARRLTGLAKGVIGAVCAVALLAVIGAVVIPLRYCSLWIANIDEQCIGIAYDHPDDVFGGRYTDVLGRIRDENARVEASGEPFVSVAYLLPLPREGRDEELAAALRRDLIGAHVAQHRANHTRTLGETPLVRLVVANHGELAEHWQYVVPDLIDMAAADSPENLVAVAVGGQSLLNTGNAIDTLVRAGVPVLTVRLTADDLLRAPPGPETPLARLAPSNSDQAVAAATYLRPIANRAILVQDSNPVDTYATGLGAAFLAAFPDPTHEVLEPTEFFDSSLGNAANTMAEIVSNICLQRPDVVYFAGRSPELEALVLALPSRPCMDLRVRIVAGSDGVLFANSAARATPELRRGLEANAEIIYTPVAHPGSWAAAPGAFQPEAPQFLAGSCDSCLDRLFPGESLDDGAVIMGYDAVVAAVSAVRFFGVNDTAPLVGQRFKRMHGSRAIPGASGWLSFEPTGEARDKAIPVLRVAPDGTQQFLQLTSPDGVPCVPDGTSC
jgi:hypothetical protein